MHCINKKGGSEMKYRNDISYVGKEIKIETTDISTGGIIEGHNTIERYIVFGIKKLHYTEEGQWFIRDITGWLKPFLREKFSVKLL